MTFKLTIEVGTDRMILSCGLGENPLRKLRGEGRASVLAAEHFGQRTGGPAFSYKQIAGEHLCRA